MASTIRELRGRLGLKQAAFGKLVGADQTTVSRWESGKQLPEREFLVRLARIAGKSVEEFAGIDASRSVVVNDLPVIGRVQAGEWVEAVEWPKEDRYSIAVPRNPLYANIRHFGLEVRGPSMDILYPEGTVLDCVLFEDIARQPSNDERVIVERRRADGLIEASVKEYRVDGRGDAWLWPRSTSPEFQAPISLAKPAVNGNGAIEETRITALVTGSYRFE